MAKADNKESWADFEVLPFLREIYRQCRWGLRSHAELKQVLASIAAYDVDLEPWFHVQNLLVCACIVSRFLWPTPALEERGRALREFLRVPEDSPLADRHLRNDLEHIDERLDKWRAEDGTTHVDTNVSQGDLSRFIAGLSATKYSYFRNYDMETNVVTFWDHTVDIEAVAAALGAIVPLIEPYIPERALPKGSSPRRSTDSPSTADS
jgi:hypothetical protein